MGKQKFWIIRTHANDTYQAEYGGWYGRHSDGR